MSVKYEVSLTSDSEYSDCEGLHAKMWISLNKQELFIKLPNGHEIGFRIHDLKTVLSVSVNEK